MMIKNRGELLAHGVERGRHVALDIIEHALKSVDPYQATKRVIALNAAPIAEEAGNLLAVNSVMVGALFATGRLPLSMETIKTVIHARFPSKLASDNIRAFELGYQSCVQARKKLSL